MSSNNSVVPPPEEQAAEILEILRDRENIDVSPDIAPADIVDNIDPEKPVSVNLRTVAEAFEGTL